MLTCGIRLGCGSPPLETEVPYYEYPRPALTVDVVLLRLSSNREYDVLLIQRGSEPFKGSWALPGGFVEEGETLEAAARRELLEETGLDPHWLKQFGVYGDPGRDPRGWVVSVAFAVWVTGSDVVRAGSDAVQVQWHPNNNLPLLAFDHKTILYDALKAKP
jgi:8-oxo-dGTP diphosphatase